MSPVIAYNLALSVAKQVFKRKFDIQLMPSNYKLGFDSRKAVKARKTREKHYKISKREQRTTSFVLISNHIKDL